MASSTSATIEKTKTSTARGVDEGCDSLSDRDEAPMPIELSADAQEAPAAVESTGVFTRLFKRATAAMVAVKNSEWPDDYIKLVQRVDLYHIHIEQATAAIISLAQPDASYQPSPQSDHNFSMPRNEGQWESVETALNKYRGVYAKADTEGINAITNAAAIAASVGKVTRDLQIRTRRALHSLRTFLLIDMPALNAERRALIGARRQMDVERALLEANPIDPRRKAASAAADQAFGQQMQKVIAIIETIPAKRIEHTDTLYAVAREIHVYHLDAAAECAKVRALRTLNLLPLTNFDANSTTMMSYEDC